MIGSGWSLPVSRTIQSAALFALGGYRIAHTFVGARRIVPINTQSTYTGEVESVIAKSRRALASSKALVNTPAVYLPDISTQAVTKLLAYAWEPPNYVGQSWRSIDASTVDSCGFTTRTGNAYFFASRLLYGGDYQISGGLRLGGSGGTAYQTAYAEVGYGTGGAPSGPLIMALRWKSGEPIELFGLDANGRIWKRGTAASGVNVSGTLQITGSLGFLLTGDSTPDTDVGSLIPTLFTGMWLRKVSDGDLSALVREACAIGSRAGLIGLPNTYAARVAANDSLKLRANTNGARALFTLG